jgi:hypothetical protein
MAKIASGLMSFNDMIVGGRNRNAKATNFKSVEQRPCSLYHAEFKYALASFTFISSICYPVKIIQPILCTVMRSVELQTGAVKWRCFVILLSRNGPLSHWPRPSRLHRWCHTSSEIPAASVAFAHQMRRPWGQSPHGLLIVRLPILSHEPPSLFATQNHFRG